MGFALLLAAVLFLLAHCGQRKHLRRTPPGQNQQSEQTLTGQVNSTKESGPEKTYPLRKSRLMSFPGRNSWNWGPRGVWPLWESTTDTFPVEAEKTVATRRAPFPISVQSFGDMMQK